MRVDDGYLLGDTPFVAIDLDIMERNIRTIAGVAKAAGVKLRPHTKTHKSPYIAQRQIEAGASGITVAKLGEAEVMANAGILDILIAFPLVGETKLARLERLLDRADVMVALDDVRVAQGIAAVGQRAHRSVPLYVDVDTGIGRMGRSPQESVRPILEIARLRHVEIRGLMSHAGHAYAGATDAEVRAVAIEDAALLVETKELLAQAGLDVPEISVGATATARFAGELPITEMRPGMYVFNDRNVMGAFGATPDDCALTVVSTVVAHPAPDRYIIDAGSKALARDPYKGPGFGHILGHDELTLAALSEEHGTIRASAASAVEIGDVLEIIPNHVCSVCNLTDRMYGFRNGRMERTIEVQARGMVR